MNCFLPQCGLSPAVIHVSWDSSSFSIVCLALSPQLSNSLSSRLVFATRDMGTESHAARIRLLPSIFQVTFPEDSMDSASVFFPLMFTTQGFRPPKVKPGVLTHTSEQQQEPSKVSSLRLLSRWFLGANT